MTRYNVHDRVPVAALSLQAIHDKTNNGASLVVGDVEEVPAWF
jgi:hypothetical protein